jgi:hypothetical protein
VRLILVCLMLCLQRCDGTAQCRAEIAGSQLIFCTHEGSSTEQEPADSKASARADKAREKKAMENQKRRIPKVDPVSREGVRYEVVRGAKSRNFHQNGGVLAAIKEATGRELWTLVVYQIEFAPREEQDVQEVYITKLRLNKDGTQLLVENEKGQRFAVNLVDRKVELLQKPGKEEPKVKRRAT